MVILNGNGRNEDRVVVSLCDYTGNWPRPYHEAGHTVVLVDLKHGDDVLDRLLFYRAITALQGKPVGGLLMAPPCTDFSRSGAQYWPRKDADGTTAVSVRIVEACLLWPARIRTAGWWALENPSGRLPKLVPELGKGWFFQPHWYAGWGKDTAEREANRYTKLTGLWGRFTKPTRSDLEPIRACSQGSWLQKLGGKSERTKELRSATPMGFARAFKEANPASGSA